MPTCKKCSKSFPNHIILNNKKRNLQHRKFCIECSPFGAHNTRSELDLNISQEQPCSTCNESLSRTSDNFYFRDSSRTGLRSNCKKCSNKKTIQFQSAQKEKFVKYKGGKCAICGYNRCIKALDFHHLDPSKKESSLSQGRSRKFETSLKELDKCILVCSNCHREIHAGLHENNPYLNNPELKGLEPSASPVTGERSNQLSYSSIKMVDRVGFEPT